MSLLALLDSSLTATGVGNATLRSRWGMTLPPRCSTLRLWWRGGSARLSPDRGSGHYSGVSYVSTDHCFPQMCVESNICSFLNTCFIERYDISSWFKYSMSEAVAQWNFFRLIASIVSSMAF